MPTNVTRPGRVGCWFSHCSKGFSLGSLVFLPPQKPITPNSISIRTEDPQTAGFRCGDRYFLVTVMFIKSGNTIYVEYQDLVII